MRKNFKYLRIYISLVEIRRKPAANCTYIGRVKDWGESNNAFRPMTISWVGLGFIVVERNSVLEKLEFFYLLLFFPLPTLHSVPAIKHITSFSSWPPWDYCHRGAFSFSWIVFKSFKQFYKIRV